MTEVERSVIDRLRPTASDKEAMSNALKLLSSQLQTAVDFYGLGAVPSVQGSVAKDTWIAGHADIDMFLLYPMETEEKEMAVATKGAATSVLNDVRERYAQHPYVVGFYSGYEVDCVPAYKIDDPAARMSSVDRTPFHTAWVNEHLTPALRDDVRLTKQWMKGVEVYGAETAIGGFSGYLVEVLVIQLGSFTAVLDWLAAEAPTVPGIESAASPTMPLRVNDPVDAQRNCAAAVTPTTLRLAVAAAKAYLAGPAERFFFPQESRVEPTRMLADRLQDVESVWLGWYFPQVNARLDIVYPQFQKAGARIAAELVAAGFSVRATHAWTHENKVGIQWLIDSALLPESKTHYGPPPGAGENAARFCEKWEKHPDALDGVAEIDGRLAVEVVIRHRSAAAWLANIVGATDFGKHVRDARAHATVLDDIMRVPSGWSPKVADFILSRRPWER
jgi:tRNA nucleotidyltransferase (CCA-adding enzyme)